MEGMNRVFKTTDLYFHHWAAGGQKGRQVFALGGPFLRTREAAEAGGPKYPHSNTTSGTLAGLALPQY